MSTTASPTGKKNIRSETAALEPPYIVIEECATYFGEPSDEERADYDRAAAHVRQISQNSQNSGAGRFLATILSEPTKQTFPTTLKT